MYMTEANKRSLVAIAQWVATHVPEDIYVSTDGLHVGFQAEDQEGAARIRRLLPGLVWRKKYNDIGWWEYEAHSPELGCDFKIYAVTEAPPTCRIERRTVEVEEDVPIAFEKRIVQKEVVEVYCGEDQLQ